MDEDDIFRNLMIAIVMIFVISGIFGLIDNNQDSNVEIEAIKAGLVQDNLGHWVKPEKAEKE